LLLSFDFSAWFGFCSLDMVIGLSCRRYVETMYGCETVAWALVAALIVFIEFHPEILPDIEFLLRI